MNVTTKEAMKITTEAYTYTLPMLMGYRYAFDKAFFGDAINLPADAVMVQQELACTSPIWCASQ